MTDDLVVRLHGWYAGRWWAYATLTAGLLAAASDHTPAVAALTAAAAGLYARVRWRFHYGFFVSVPVGWFLLAWWPHIAETAVYLMFGWAVWQTLEWWQTTYTFTGDHLEVVHGIVNTRTAQIPRRRMIQAQQNRTPLGKLLGYTHVQFETAAQVEFVDRVRFARPEMYGYITRPGVLG